MFYIRPRFTRVAYSVAVHVEKHGMWIGMHVLREFGGIKSTPSTRSYNIETEINGAYLRG